jgi:hypothetical protein
LGHGILMRLVKLIKLVLDSDVEAAMFCLDHFVEDTSFEFGSSVSRVPRWNGMEMEARREPS